MTAVLAYLLGWSPLLPVLIVIVVEAHKARRRP